MSAELQLVTRCKHGMTHKHLTNVYGCPGGSVEVLDPERRVFVVMVYDDDLGLTTAWRTVQDVLYALGQA